MQLKTPKSYVKRIKGVFPTIAATLIIGFFSYTSLTKILHFQKFSQQMQNQPLPKSWTPFITYGIPCVEILAFLLLVLPRSRHFGFYVAATLFALFTIYTSLVLLQAFAYIPCSCGGIVDWLDWRSHLVLNAGFLILSVIAAIYTRPAVVKRNA